MAKKVTWFLINENYGANLFPFGFHFDANYRGWKKQFGTGCNYQSVGTANGYLKQAYGLEDYNRMAKFFFNKFTGNKQFTYKVLNSADGVCDDFYKYNHKLAKENLSVITDRQLAVIFKKFHDYFYQMSVWSVPFSYTEYGTPLWTDALTDYLYTLKIPFKYTVLEIFQILTDNAKKTHTAKEKISILKLSIEVKKSKKLSAIFKKSSRQIIKELEGKNLDFLKKIQRHERKYNWINFGFEGPLLDLEYFVSSIKDWAKKEPQKELNKVIKHAKGLAIQQRKTIQQLNIDKKHQWMFWVVKQFSFHKTYRKDVEYYSYYIYDNFLLKELGRRLGITVNQGHYLMIEEILAILQGKKEVDINELNERLKRNFLVINNSKPKILTGNKALLHEKKIKSRKIPKNLKELQGQCASKGEARGEVKIIKNKEDYVKFNSGDILVSYATNPNMVPLMKKASAVITDEGGVTCHAAIVSRELGIPCVIGTRFATKILKDGQKVEVNATKGIIKKV